MAERRGTDLTWGQLGEATYDAAEQKWSFLRQPVLPSILQPLKHLEQCLPPAQSFKTDYDPVDPKTRKPKNTIKRDVIRQLPGMAPALPILNELLPTRTEEGADEVRNTASDLIAVGAAQIVGGNQTGHYRDVPVLVSTYGSGGNILRITKPRMVDHSWTDHSDAAIRAFDPENGEHGFWFDGADAIEQVIFASDTEGKQSWLAVRQLACTTILRPYYHSTDPVPQTVPARFGSQYPPSKVEASFVCKIVNEDDLDRKAHVDVAFNPWYPRQFAILDQSGTFRIWDLEGQRRGIRRTIAGKSGHIYDDMAAHNPVPGDAAGAWGRFLWAGNVTTVVVCSKRHLAVFDMRKTKPVRIKCPVIFRNDETEHILEMKRCPTWHDRVVILTTYRLILLKISTEYDPATKSGGVCTLLSCAHYREAHGTSLKLDVKGKDDATTMFLYFPNEPLVSVFRVHEDTAAASPLRLTTDSFFLEQSSKDSASHAKPAALYMHRLARGDNDSGEERSREEEFYQVFAQAADKGLSQTLLAGSSAAKTPTAQRAAYYIIQPPNQSMAVTEKTKGRRSRPKTDSAVDELVVPIVTGYLPTATPLKRKHSYYDFLRQNSVQKTVEEGAKVINAESWYEFATVEKPYHCARTKKCKGHENPREKSCRGRADEDVVMSDCLEKIRAGVEQSKQSEQQGLFTFQSFAGFEKLIEDVDDGASLLKNFVENLHELDDEGSDLAVRLREARIGGLLGFDKDAPVNDELHDLSKIYDQLVDLWLLPLPEETPGPVRLAKERLARTVAAELCLNSLMVQVINRPQLEGEFETQTQHSQHRLSLNERVQSSQQIRSSPPLAITRSGLPTITPEPPSSAPSVDQGPTPHSQLLTPAPSDSRSLAGERAEDPATARLRAYASHVKSQKPLGATRARVLAQWPSEPGSDPNLYVWTIPNLHTSIEEDSDDEAVQRRRKEEDKRRRKTERHLKRQQRQSAWGIPGFSSQPAGGSATVQASQTFLPPGYVSQPTQISVGRKTIGSGTSFGSQGIVSAPQSFGSIGFGGSFTQRDVPRSSQTVGVGSQPMTQPIPGLYGGRQSMGGVHKKKKRKTGF